MGSRLQCEMIERCCDKSHLRFTATLRMLLHVRCAEPSSVAAARHFLFSALKIANDEFNDPTIRAKGQGQYGAHCTPAGWNWGSPTEALGFP